MISHTNTSAGMKKTLLFKPTYYYVSLTVIIYSILLLKYTVRKEFAFIIVSKVYIALWLRTTTRTRSHKDKDQGLKSQGQGQGQGLESQGQGQGQGLDFSKVARTRTRT